MCPTVDEGRESQRHIDQQRRPHLPAHAIGAVARAVGQLERLLGLRLGLLEEKASIPMVQQQQMAVIQEIQTDEWCQDVTEPMLDQARKRLRLLMKLIEKLERKPIYTEFEDAMGTETMFELPGFSPRDRCARVLAKARHFLKDHGDHLTIHKLRSNEPLTPTNLAVLEEC